tara:strand:+ start:525 stop:1397 length:873 start_codon:yes stop_codon:yes gene_type:complete
MLMLAGPPIALAQEPVADTPLTSEAPAETARETTAVLTPTRSQVQELSLERLLPATQQRRLNIGEQAFLGLFLPAAQPQPWGGIILIAGQDEHADWPMLIAPARRQLSAAGWHTLAISLPERDAPEHGLEASERLTRDDAYREQTLARIQAARQVLIAEGGEQQNLPVVLLGRGEGAFWALSAAVAVESTAEAANPLAAALILQGLRQTTQGETTTNHLLEQWSGPTYDILMSRPEQAEARRLQAKRLGHDRYRQLLWPQGETSELQQQILIKRLDGWLQRVLNETPDSV